MDISEKQATYNQSRKLRICIKILTKRCKKLWEHLTLEQRWYFFAIAFPMLILIYSNVSELFSAPEPEAKEAAFFAFLVCSAVGIFHYLSKLTQQISNNVLLKACSSTLFVATVTLALSFSDTLINETLKVSSTPFAYTQTITALLLIPIFIAFIAVALAVLSFFLISFSRFISTFKLSNDNEIENHFSLITLFARCGLLFFFAHLGNNALTQADGYKEFISGVIQHYAYEFEMEKYTHCESIDGERFAYIDSNTVVVATKREEKYEFKVRACKESIAQGVGRTVDETTKGLIKGFSERLR